MKRRYAEAAIGHRPVKKECVIEDPIRAVDAPLDTYGGTNYPLGFFAGALAAPCSDSVDIELLELLLNMQRQPAPPNSPLSVD
ncbi:hypothetical protein ON010_g15944 [Phytophthora cinnamomi]|nr:hypothetical protein ON010_g15944 [Phytophthora cinnamomi]